MPSYLITNRIPDSFQPGPEAATAWTAWFEQLGSHVEDRGNPAFARASLGNVGSDTVLGGYTLISADSLDEAVALTKTHPLMTRGGGVEIGELTVINEGKRLIADAGQWIFVSAEGIHKGVTRQLRQVDVTDAGRRLIAFAQERPQKVESRT